MRAYTIFTLPQTMFLEASSRELLTISAHEDDSLQQSKILTNEIPW